MNVNSTKTHNINNFLRCIFTLFIYYFLKPINEAIEFSMSKLIATCFISTKLFTVLLSGSIITVPLVSSFINSAISINSYAPGIRAKIRVSDHVSPWVSYKN